MILKNSLRIIFVVLSISICPSISEAKGILFIGDSHSVWTFGEELDSKLRTLGTPVHSYASCGSRPEWWFDGTPTPCGYAEQTKRGNRKYAKSHATPNYSDLLKSTQPDLVVIALGGNLYGWSASHVEEEVRNIVTETRRFTSNCVWVGPPDYLTQEEARPDHPQYEKLKKDAGAVLALETIRKSAADSGCTFIDSNLFTHYPENTLDGDGIHYEFEAGKPLAREWARKVFEEIHGRLEISRRSGFKAH